MSLKSNNPTPRVGKKANEVATRAQGSLYKDDMLKAANLPKINTMT